MVGFAFSIKYYNKKISCFIYNIYNVYTKKKNIYNVYVFENIY